MIVTVSSSNFQSILKIYNFFYWFYNYTAIKIVKIFAFRVVIF